jgi:hypothetical protein
MKILAHTLAVLMLLPSTSALATTVVPLKGQTSQTIQQDTGTCQSQANAQHPVQNSVPSGGRAKGAVTGAVAGATAAEVRGRQHDQIDDDTRQDYRQNQARSTAAAGAVVGASRQRQARRQNLAASEQSVTANNSVYSSCLQQRGYDVLP